MELSSAVEAFLDHLGQASRNERERGKNEGERGRVSWRMFMP
jgi:hypothetical protein